MSNNGYITWHTEKRRISELRPARYNPRQLTEKQSKDLSTSLERFNLADPIVINKNNTIIGGHQRINILKQSGDMEVDVRIPSRKLTEGEEKELNLRLNKNLGEWDYDALANLDEDMLKDVGFESEELDKIFQLDVDKDADEVPETRNTNIKQGDVFVLGEHRLLCGDATKREDVELLMAGQKADMVFTDPPYGLGGYAGRSGKFKSIKGDDENVAKFYQLVPLAKEMYIWGNYKCLQHLERMPRDVIVWKKNNIGMGKGYRGQYELCFYYGEFKGSDSDVWTIAKDAKYNHPTQKPVELCERALFNSSIRENIVLDIFGGSGSTLIACERLNRKCYMMEIDPVYCQVIIDRWEKFTGQKAKNG